MISRMRITPVHRRHVAVMAAAVVLCLLTAAVLAWLRPESAPPLRPAAAVPPATSPAPSPSPSPSPSPVSPVTRWTTGTNDVALTFDDGPDPVNTPKLLDLLAEHRVKATFCLVGHRVRDNQELVRRIVAEGHTLCNHSWQHLDDLGKREEKYLVRDLEATNEQLRKASGGKPVAWFRAPYGYFSGRLNGFAAQKGMVPVGWNVDDGGTHTAGYGRGEAMVRHIIRTVQRDTRPGSIILSHDNGKPFTVTAYRTLLPWLKARFTLVPLPEAG